MYDRMNPVSMASNSIESNRSIAEKNGKFVCRIRKKPMFGQACSFLNYNPCTDSLSKHWAIESQLSSTKTLPVTAAEGCE